MRTTPVSPRAWLRSHPLFGDSVLAVLLAVLSLAFAGLVSAQDASQGRLPAYSFNAVAAVLAVGTCLLTALRRRWPFVLLCLAQLPQIALAALRYEGGLVGLVTLILLYTVAAYRGLALSLVAAAVALATYAVSAVIAFDAGGWTQHAIVVVVTMTVWVGGRSVRLRRAYLAELVDRAERLERAREADTRAARAEERSRIARELHDVVAHHVSVMTVQAAAARKVLETRPEAARDALVAIEEMGRTAMREMRGIVGVLRTDGESGELAPQPGMVDLPGLVDQMREAGLRAQLWIEGERPVIPPGIDLAAYRLVQEALTNSLRHAGPAARAWVTVRHEQGELLVHVEDDGHGGVEAPQRGPGDRPGHGLVGIRERVALYGGVLRIGPRQGGGFEVRARFPLKD
ncbi:two-component sensor histidine kinase [Sphaerisporangium krabiense]|uniref:histidine kinase n=1 Tax=Sphaerisporangium krabiense TaxID=763782 RepID=A0A7W9DV65_9ACTN|nr:sensor histidine kinase [Sphaerisporangium krabiense]MBB5631135.1 signal transduction histidine kinase [Sphaerisporangium krabiense]GII61254.1 two-component sensor histidine kinase [Sphaerisporangium krabiense]